MVTSLDGLRLAGQKIAFIAFRVPAERGKRPAMPPGPLRCIPPAAALGSLASVALSSEPARMVYRVGAYTDSEKSVRVRPCGIGILPMIQGLEAHATVGVERTN
jgi:hypothetical protein